MPMSLDDIVNKHPMITLSHVQYGRNLYLGQGVNICTSPAQRLQAFVNEDNVPCRFMVVGRLMSFKVVEDSVRIDSSYVFVTAHH
jgi:hypothetical protein